MKKDHHRFTHTRTWHITHSNMHKNTRTQTHTNTYNINAKHTLRTHQDPEIDKREKKKNRTLNPQTTQRETMINRQVGLRQGVGGYREAEECVGKESEGRWE